MYVIFNLVIAIDNSGHVIPQITNYKFYYVLENIGLSLDTEIRLIQLN